MNSEILPQILRLENMIYPNQPSDSVDRVLEFHPPTNDIKTHNLTGSGIKIPFDMPQSEVITMLAALGVTANADTRIIHNQPVEGAYSAPLKVYLDINNMCALACRMCLADAGIRRRSVMSLDTASSIADEIIKNGILRVKIGGGDPFLHPDFPEILSIIRKTGAFITTSTNSISMTDERAQLLADHEVGTSVSIEGMQVTNDLIRGDDHFQKAMDIMRMLKEFGVNAKFRVTLMPQNIFEIPQMVDLAKTSGVLLKVSYCRPAGRALDGDCLITNSPEHQSVYRDVIRFLNGKDIIPYVQLDEGMMQEIPVDIIARLGPDGIMCGAGRRSMHVNAEGKISPCIFLGHKYAESTRLYAEGKTLMNFWREGVMFRTIRRYLPPTQCDGCGKACIGECPASRQAHNNGDIYGDDPNCTRYINI